MEMAAFKGKIWFFFYIYTTETGNVYKKLYYTTETGNVYKKLHFSLNNQIIILFYLYYKKFSWWWVYILHCLLQKNMYEYNGDNT